MSIPVAISPTIQLPSPAQLPTKLDIAASIKAAATHFRAGNGKAIPGTHGLEFYETAGIRIYLILMQMMQSLNLLYSQRVGNNSLMKNFGQSLVNVTLRNSKNNHQLLSIM